MKLPLSLVIITKDEERNIARVIKSVPFVDEVLVMDSGSSDKTTEIALSLGAKVIHQPWLGFGPQKQRAAELARNDWILSLDADEALSEALARELVDFFDRNDHLQPGNMEVAFGMPRKSWYLGRWILHGGWYPDRQVRFFNRRFAKWSQALIHEKIEAKQIRSFSSDIEHYVFANISQHIRTNDSYSSLQAQEYLNSGGEFSYFKWLIKPPVKFIECYFLKAGFLDGLPGFFIAISAAYSVFLRWSKVWEIKKSSKSFV